MRSTSDRSIHGVCGGIAEFFGISSFPIRLIFIINPFHWLVYIILANAIPEKPASL